MRLIETDVLTDTNIATAVSIGSYTATVVGGVIVRVLVKGAAGNGDYIIYATLTKSAQEYQIVPITTAPVASGRTAFGFVSLAIPVDVDDILQVYIDGLAGDTATPDTRVDFYTYDYLRPTVTGRTLDVSATGEAGVDWANVGTPGSTVTLTNTQINSVSGSVGGKVLGGGSDTITGIGAQVASSGGLTAQQTRDAMLLAPTAGTPADGSIDDHLDDLATALAAATSTLTVVSAVDGGEIDIYQAVSLSATISGLAIPAGWTKVYWTVKRATSEADADAILQLVETNPAAGTDGLLRLNGAAGTAANGTLTVNQAAGTVVIDLVMTICDDLALATGLVWSLKALHPTSAATLLATGTINVLGQATAAVA